MLLLHFDRTRAVFSRNHESSEIVIGLWSSKLRMEWRSCRSLANGEIAFDWAAEKFYKLIFFPGQGGLTAGSGGAAPIYG